MSGFSLLLVLLLIHSDSWRLFLSSVLIYLCPVFMPCVSYALHAFKINVTDGYFLFVYLFLMLAGRPWRKWGRTKMEVMLKRNHREFISGSADIQYGVYLRYFLQWAQ